jgi:hypothetical protein
MTKGVCYSLAAIALLIAGCGDDKPAAPASVPVVTVAQQNAEIEQRLDTQKLAQERAALAEAQAADRIRFAEVLQRPLDQWGELYGQLPGKQPKEVAEIGAKMQAIRAEMQATPTTPCTFAAREKIFQGMDQVGAVINEFRSLTGAVPESLGKRLGEGESVAREGARDLIVCKDIR